MRIKRNIDSRIEPHPIPLADFSVNNSLANEIFSHGIKINA